MTEHLHIRTVEPGHCSTCGLELTDRPDLERLELELDYDGKRISCTFCRSCLEEHTPEMLDLIRQDQTEGLSI